MPQTSCLYSLIAGTARPVPLKSPHETEHEAGRALTHALLQRLEEARVNAFDLVPSRIPLVCELLRHEDENSAFGFWLSPSQFTVDKLIDLQANRRAGQWVSNLHYTGNTNKDGTICAMANASGVDRALAILGVAVAEEALYCDYTNDDSPWSRDRKLCEMMIKDMRTWAEEEAPLPQRYGYYGNDVLFQTPFAVSESLTNDIAHDFLDHIAARIAHCMKTHRPIVIIQTKTIPNTMVSTLIDMSKEERALA